MGLRSAAMACQRITSSVCFICETEGHHTLSYLDDFIGVAPPDTAWQAYEHCGHLLEELGLEESLTKACPPTTIATCLGVQFDTVQMTMSVTPEHFAEIESLLSAWSGDLPRNQNCNLLSVNSLLFRNVLGRADCF